MNPSTPKKRAVIHTLGCRLNQAESGLIADQLAAAGYALVPFGEPADLGVIHTCTVTREADAKSRQLIRRFIQAHPGARTVVIGCYAQTGADTLLKLDGVDLVIGNREKLNLLRHLDALEAGGPKLVREPMTRAPFTIGWTPEGPPVTERVNLKIQDGCDFMCTFCVIPFARGRSRSRDFDDLAAEAAALARRGARELVVTGVNSGDYACAGRTITDVVDALAAAPGVARVRLGSVEMTTIPDGLLERMADPGHPLVPHLHVPLQSGSDRVLELMRRHHTAGEYLAFMRRAAALVPDIGLGADVMVGFPGETAEDFTHTRALIAESPLNYTHVFAYSGRAGTAASRLPEKTDPAAAAERSAVLRALDAEKQRAFAERHLGREVEVLFEQCERGWWTGHTGNYLRAAAKSDENLTNRIGRVVVETAEEGRVFGRLNGPVV